MAKTTMTATTTDASINAERFVYSIGVIRKRGLQALPCRGLFWEIFGSSQGDVIS